MCRKTGGNLRRMSQIFKFGEIEKDEAAIKKTWAEFRQALAEGAFLYDDVSNAKKYTFLKTYDDLFNQHLGIKHTTIHVNNLKSRIMGRGTILEDAERLGLDMNVIHDFLVEEDSAPRW